MLTTWEQDALRAGAYREAFSRQGVREGDVVRLADDSHPEFPAVVLALMGMSARIALGSFSLDQVRQLSAQLAQQRLWTFAGRTRHAPEGILQGGAGCGAPTRAVDTSEIRQWGCLDDALVQRSSGTTGEHKLVLKRGHAVLANARETARVLGYRPQDVLAPVLPLHLQYGFSVLVARLLVGAGFARLPYTRFRHIPDGLRRFGATVVDATPGIYAEMIRNQPSSGLTGLDGVRLWCTGGSTLSQQARDRFEAITAAQLWDGYGSTELGNVSFSTPRNPGGCGPVIDGVQVVLRDSPAAVTAGAGELCVRSDHAMSGYLGEAAHKPSDWFATGDLASLDEQGSLRILGRIHGVDRKGVIVYPQAIAQRAAASGDEVHVFPIEDERRGHRIVAVVVDPAQRPVHLWRRRLHSLLEEHERPDEVHVVSALSVNGSGKHDAASLAESLVNGRGYVQG